MTVPGEAALERTGWDQALRFSMALGRLENQLGGVADTIDQLADRCDDSTTQDALYRLARKIRGALADDPYGTRPPAAPDYDPDVIAETWPAKPRYHGGEMR